MNQTNVNERYAASAIMSALFPYANTITAILVFLIGFGFHFVGQLISVLNWELACKLGLQESNSPPDYYPLEHGTAVGDVLVAWVYAVAAVGLLLGADWGYKLVWILVQSSYITASALGTGKSTGEPQDMAYGATPFD